jgi:hypothetical protein
MFAVHPNTAPVGAELERHDDAGDHTHPEGNGEDLYPEGRDAQVDGPARPQIQPFQDRDVRRQPDRERGQQKVKCDNKRKLQP